MDSDEITYFKCKYRRDTRCRLDGYSCNGRYINWIEYILNPHGICNSILEDYNNDIKYIEKHCNI